MHCVCCWRKLSAAIWMNERRTLFSCLVNKDFIIIICTTHFPYANQIIIIFSPSVFQRWVQILLFKITFWLLACSVASHVRCIRKMELFHKVFDLCWESCSFFAVNKYYCYIELDGPINWSNFDENYMHVEQLKGYFTFEINAIIVSCMGGGAL